MYDINQTIYKTFNPCPEIINIYDLSKHKPLSFSQECYYSIIISSKGWFKG